MVFSSLFFVFIFLPLCMLVYSLVKTIQAKNIVLVCFSLMFYAWTGLKYLVLLVGMVAINWLAGIYIEQQRGRFLAKFAVVTAVTSSLVLLGILKYTGFLCTNLQSLFGFPQEIPNIILPIGISFYTFQLLSYTVDVYRGDVKGERSFLTVFLYASLFHQCIAGPIVRYSDVSYEIYNRKANLAEASNGVTRFAIGLAKKVLIANACATIADLFIPDINAIGSVPALSIWLSVLMYMMQIYFDFSAYSDMAIGMGLMIGFHYKENFNYPYTSKSISEFWRRWHISLGTFFRDYVYFPLGGNRKGVVRTIINLFVVWFLTGLWHGASWNFVLWGLYFFIFIVMEKLFLQKLLDKAPKFVSYIYCFVIVYFGWILFKYSDMGTIGSILKGMFCLNGNKFITLETRSYLLGYLFFMVAVMFAFTPLFKNLYKRIFNSDNTVFGVRTIGNILEIIYPLVLVALSALALIGDSYNPFLYFQF